VHHGLHDGQAHVTYAMHLDVRHVEIGVLQGRPSAGGTSTGRCRTSSRGSGCGSSRPAAPAPASADSRDAAAA
jgi:hypothetical protein